MKKQGAGDLVGLVAGDALKEVYAGPVSIYAMWMS
jgi:hypothetical protein